MSHKWLLLADFHLYVQRLEKQKATIQWIKDTTLLENPTHVLFLGDSFHMRNSVCIESQLVFRDLLHFLQNAPSKPSVHILVGNHDMAYRNDREINFPALFEDRDKNTFVYSEITQVMLDGFPTIFIPWHEDHNIIKSYLSNIENSDQCVVFAHIAVNGTKVNGISDESKTK